MTLLNDISDVLENLYDGSAEIFTSELQNRVNGLAKDISKTKEELRKKIKISEDIHTTLEAFSTDCEEIASLYKNTIDIEEIYEEQDFSKIEKNLEILNKQSAILKGQLRKVQIVLGLNFLACLTFSYLSGKVSSYFLSKTTVLTEGFELSVVGSRMTTMGEILSSEARALRNAKYAGYASKAGRIFSFIAKVSLVLDVLCVGYSIYEIAKEKKDEIAELIKELKSLNDIIHEIEENTRSLLDTFIKAVSIFEPEGSSAILKFGDKEFSINSIFTNDHLEIKDDSLFNEFRTALFRKTSEVKTNLTKLSFSLQAGCSLLMDDTSIDQVKKIIKIPQEKIKNEIVDKLIENVKSGQIKNCDQLKVFIDKDANVLIKEF